MLASIGTPIRAGISPISPPSATYSISLMDDTHLRKPTNITSAGKVSTGPTLWIIAASHRSQPIGNLLLIQSREGRRADLASCRARRGSDEGTVAVLRRCALGRVVRQHWVETISEPLVGTDATNPARFTQIETYDVNVFIGRVILICQIDNVPAAATGYSYIFPNGVDKAKASVVYPGRGVGTGCP